MSSAKIILVRLALVLASVMMLAGVALPAAGPASASSLPKVQTAGMGGNWSGTWRVRPGAVYFGSYFFIKDLRYRYYNGTHAYAHGRLLVDNCRPTCAQAGYFANATAYFWVVFNHRGPGKHFGYLRLRWGRHLQHSMLLWISSAGWWAWR
jgi:hypothetical protein